MEKNKRSIINAWSSYDIANSAYNLTITATIFPIYYQEVTQKIWNHGIIESHGLIIKNTVIYNYAIALAYAIIMIISPLLSGIADYSGLRKLFMKFFTIIGSISCIMLFGFNGRNVFYGLFWAGLAVIGYAGSLVFYNSFLPLIATVNYHDKISARGYALGYAGSVFLLIGLIFMITKHQLFNIENSQLAVKLSFIIVGMWWLLIAQFAFYYLKEPIINQKLSLKILTNGYLELKKVMVEIRKTPSILIFLSSFFLFSAGVQTILLVASLFGSAVLHIKAENLMLLIITIQIVAILGSLFFGWLSQQRGNKFSILIMLLLWIMVCISAYYVETEKQFYAISSLAGCMMGGIQSQARSTYSKLIPIKTFNTASYFSFYDITEKASIVLGMFLFGYIEQFTGNMRISALFLSLLFILALILILFFRMKK